MLLNLTNRLNFIDRDLKYGVIYGGTRPFRISTNSFRIYNSSLTETCFGGGGLYTREPFLGKGNVISYLNYDCFNTVGKAGDINPLTGDIIVNHVSPKTISTAIDIEVWHIVIEEDHSETNLNILEQKQKEKKGQCKNQ